MNAHQIAQDLSERFQGMDGEDMLATIIEDVFVDRICLVSSFGIEAAVLLSMVSRIKSELPVIFIDTQKLFPETLEYRDHLIEHLSLTDVRTYYPEYADTAYKDANGDLWQTNTNGCCYIRKVKPLERALKGFDAWITGRKRFHGGQRMDIPMIEAANGKVKINPLANWSREDISDSFREYNIPAHPLLETGYLSVGCMPCTSLPDASGDPRSGRWKNQGKTECGIHLDESGRLVRDNNT